MAFKQKEPYIAFHNRKQVLNKMTRKQVQKEMSFLNLVINANDTVMKCIFIILSTIQLAYYKNNLSMSIEGGGHKRPPEKEHSNKGNRWERGCFL